MKRFLPPLLILLFAAAGGAAGFLLSSRYYDNPPPPPGVSQIAIGEKVPDGVMHDPEGRPHTFARWHGQLLVVNYWASWCPPCVEEMPMLDAWAKENADRNITVVGVAEDDPEAAMAFLREQPVGYPVLIGGRILDGSSMQLGNSRNVLPYTVVIGPDGRLLERRAGMLRRDILDGWRDRHAGPAR